MSARGPSRSPSDVFYTPAHAVQSLLAHDAEIGMFHRAREIWEPAAGAGHIARVLSDEGYAVLATDIAPAQKQLVPVTPLDFFKSTGPRARFDVVTNPPYGKNNQLAIAFILRVLEHLDFGTLALLLPFEFDSRPTRNVLVGGHQLFIGKVTVGRRIRWANLAQKAAGPMGHHAWYLWTTDHRLRQRARFLPMMVTR